MYLTDSENYGRDSVASQYFMQLAQYVKLPMISWNADNSDGDGDLIGNRTGIRRGSDYVRSELDRTGIGWDGIGPGLDGDWTGSDGI
jgi:hypothetical protein